VTPPPVILPDLLLPARPDRSIVTRVVLLNLGVLFMLLGVVGWLVPVVTGLPFYAVGIVLLGISSRRVRGWINRMERRMSEGKRVKLRRLLARIPWKRLRGCFDLGPFGDPPTLLG